MNELLKKIKDDLKDSMTLEVKLRKENKINSDEFDKAVSQKAVSRAIISMIPTLGKKPGDTTESDIVKLLTKYIRNEKERTLYELHFLKEKDVKDKGPSQVRELVSTKISQLGDELTSYVIEIAQSYLPKQVTEKEVIEFIKTIDFSKFKNKMQAMGLIMKQFPGSDGNFIKSILVKWNQE